MDFIFFRWLSILSVAFLVIAQPQIYSPVQDYTAVVADSSVPLYASQICPNNTGNVLQRAFDLYFGITYTSLGCCNIGQYGIPNTDFSGLIGCCPIGQYPCVNSISNNVAGCVSDPALCSPYGVVCPAGYGYCPSELFLTFANYSTNFLCCPLFTAQNASSYQEYCEVFNSTDVTESSFGDTLYGTCSQASLSVSANCSSGSIYVLYNSTNVTTSEPSGVLCAQYSDCVTVLQNTTMTNETLFNTTVLVQYSYYYQTIGCCSAGLVPCINEQQVLVGCSNSSLGEVCCGNQICPSGSQCCISNAPSGAASGGCCPNGLECCWQSPWIFDMFDNATQLFCGASFQNQSCYLNMWGNTGFPDTN